jgi:hypothetical protein
LLASDHDLSELKAMGTEDLFYTCVLAEDVLVDLDLFKMTLENCSKSSISDEWV